MAEDEKAALCEGGLEVRELTAEALERASRYFKQHASLALNDCFALALAEETQDGTLLSGDGSLRQAAASVGIQARGVLWVIDELEIHRVVEIRILHGALELFHEDGTIFLPENEVVRRLRRLRRMLREG